MALKEDGSVFCWGNNDHNQCLKEGLLLNENQKNYKNCMWI